MLHLRLGLPRAVWKRAESSWRRRSCTASWSALAASSPPSACPATCRTPPSLLRCAHSHRSRLESGILRCVAEVSGKCHAAMLVRPPCWKLLEMSRNKACESAWLSASSTRPCQACGAQVRAARGLPDDLVRISAGIEDVNDLLAGALCQGLVLRMVTLRCRRLSGSDSVLCNLSHHLRQCMMI